MQSVEARQRFSFNLGTWEEQGSVRLERLSNPVFQKKKKYKRPSELQHNEGRNTVASLAIPRAAAQSAQIFGGGRFYLSHPLCLTTKKSRYPKTA